MVKTISWRDYLELCKPRVVALMLLTALVGMMLAPDSVPLKALVFGMLGIALGAGAAAVVNHLVDRRIDAIMARTKGRPIVTGKISPRDALLFSGVLAISSMVILSVFVNTLTAVLTLLTLIGYAIIYTMYLKRATSQNIVIGGVAGAAPPLLGWVAVTGSVDAHSLLLVLIIYVWTPPHFWALAIHRYQDYARAKIPMLPVTHGIRFTKLSIVLYTLLLIVVSILPTIFGMSGVLYLVGALLLGFAFLYWSVRLFLTKDKTVAKKTFQFSIFYLMLLFCFLLLDHYLRV